jgi:hypothetical protein
VKVLKEEMAIRVSLGLLGTILSAVVAFTIWMTTMQFSLNANAEDVKALKAESAELKELIIRIDKNLVELNTLLKNKGEN